MYAGFSVQRAASVARKEFLHIFRDSGTLFFALFIPVIEMLMLGYAIDTNVRYVSTLVLDQAKTQESRQLLQRFESSETFRILNYPVYTDQELTEAIVSGKARVGIKIPENYSRTILNGSEPAQVLVLVDGSESSIAGIALNVANAVVLTEALERSQQSSGNPVRIELRPQTLFNPETRSPNFFIPGLMVVMTQMMAIMLSANAIVREKENGTLEQLFMTPVHASELILGKMTPYLVLTFLEFNTILFLMWTIFQVPVHGNVLTLLALALPFVLSMLGLGLWISTRVATKEAAGQMAMGTMMPSIFLSGYVFPLDSMPWFFWYVAQVFPTTWLIDASRGVILRGAGWRELWPHAIVLWSMGILVCAASMLTFRKRLS